MRLKQGQSPSRSYWLDPGVMKLKGWHPGSYQALRMESPRRYKWRLTDKWEMGGRADKSYRETGFETLVSASETRKPVHSPVT